MNSTIPSFQNTLYKEVYHFQGNFRCLDGGSTMSKHAVVISLVSFPQNIDTMKLSIEPTCTAALYHMVVMKVKKGENMITERCGIE